MKQVNREKLKVVILNLNKKYNLFNYILYTLMKINTDCFNIFGK